MNGTAAIELWWLIPLVLIGLCIFGARGCCFGRRRPIEGRPERNDEFPSGSALEILSRRYARGEIDDEEFERKRQAIAQAKKGEPR